MQETLVEVEPRAALAQPAENTVPSEAEAGKARGKYPRFRIFTASLIKFGSFKKTERDQAGSTAPSIKKVREEQKESLEGPCGLGCMAFPRCQRFNNIRCFLIFFCILVTSQCVVFGLVDLSTDNFQKENHLKTTENLVLSLTYDISSCLVVVFIAYYGGKGNIPGWITVSSLLVGSGSLLFAFPYFRMYLIIRRVKDLPEFNNHSFKMVKACKKASLSFRSKYMTFFILGQSVQGIAAIPLYVLGITFIYNSVATHSAGIYLGLVEAAGILGYALGYAIGAPLIKASVNSTFEKSDDNERWQQSWWIHFVIIAVIAWSTLIPFSCFPHGIREKNRRSRKQHDLSFWSHYKERKIKSLKYGKASESLVMIGASEFLPIYIENQFILTPSEATTLAGLVLIPGGALGQILGGIIISKLQMSCKGLMRFVMVTSAVTLVLLAFVIFVHCDSIPFAGITEDYGGTGQLGNLTAPCNSHCKCSSSFYSATCGRNDIGYFSPCFAGCTYSKTLKNHKTYYNCSCIKEGLTTSDNQGDFIDARHGTCDSKCYKLPLFIAFIFSTIVFSAFAGIPSILTILRCVYCFHGEFTIIAFFIGTIPGPVIFKTVGETSCILRDTERCGSIGSCWIYNKTKMAYLLAGVCLCLYSPYGICFSLSDLLHSV
uniref:Solute carrier organic anion transporter family member 6A1 n=1 Tax=Balaenoptera musculus TaxID=9771 RepID=A0A8C0HVC2_BALMU